MFQKLFVAPTDDAIREAEARIDRNESILDGLEAQTAALQKKISKEDARQVEAYLDSVREMERQIARDRAWLHKRRPMLTGLRSSPHKDAAGASPPCTSSPGWHC